MSAENNILELSHWLNGRPETWANVIATRAALRVLPLVTGVIGQWRLDDGTQERLLLMAFRANFLSWVAIKYPEKDMRIAAIDSFKYVKAVSDSVSLATTKPYNTSAAVSIAGDAATIIAAAASAARAAAAAVASSCFVTDVFIFGSDAYSAISLSDEAAGMAKSIFPGSHPEDLEIFRLDVECLHRSFIQSKDNPVGELINRPLWTGDSDQVQSYGSKFPDLVREPWQRFIASAFAAKFGFAPWIEWYQMALQGYGAAQLENRIWDALAIRIASQPDDWWRRGAAAVNTDIACWLEEAATDVAPDTHKGRIAVHTPSTTRLFARLPDALARNFTPDALRAPTPELFQRMLALGPGAELSALLSSFDIGGTEAPSGRMLTRDTLIVENEEVAGILKDKGAKLYRDVQFQIFEDACVPQESRCRYWEPSATPNANGADEGSLDDVLAHINVHEAWGTSEGDGATIAVIDTGVHGDLPEIGHNRRHSFNPDTFHRDRHWVDREGHGSMCAVIAAGGGLGGRFKGVAPLASVLSCRTDFTAGDISDIYLNLIEARRERRIAGPLIVNNSYGLYTCDSSGAMPDDHPYMDVIQMAIDEGIVVVFAAGNNHHDVKCKFPPGADGPNTIWGPNSHDRVLSVGTVNRNNSNQDGTTPHANSSRGPGEWAERHFKPDCVAPTYGAVIWGNERRVMSWWGTSGAAPQVSGLAALIQAFAANTPGGAFRPEEINDIVRQSCRPLSAPATCVGSGLIDCGAALKAAQRRRQQG